MKLLITIVGLFLALPSAAETNFSTATNPNVPAEYQAMMEQKRQALIVPNNPLNTQTAEELYRLYNNKGGDACIAHSRYVQGIHMLNSYKTSLCKGYQKMTPYTLSQIIDPVAVERFKDLKLKAMCERQKQYSGRGAQVSSDCSKLDH